MILRQKKHSCVWMHPDAIFLLKDAFSQDVYNFDSFLI